MIVSASRRTDIPAFYADWFMNRVREGFCDVPNPVNPAQVSRVSLRPDDVDVIVFWTRHAAPLLPYLAELDDRGFRYYFLYTLMNNPAALDPKVPDPDKAVAVFRDVAQRIGPQRVIWRYDPIVLTDRTDAAFHIEQFTRISERLAGATRRCIISFMDVYKRIRSRLAALEAGGYRLQALDDRRLGALVPSLARIAREGGLEIASCAETRDLARFGVAPGKCIDDELIESVFDVRVARRKDAAQRAECRCAASRDIGMYDTCPCGCRYCYATTGDHMVAAKRAKHDLHGTAMIGSSQGVRECGRVNNGGSQRS